MEFLRYHSHIIKHLFGFIAFILIIGGNINGSVITTYIGYIFAIMFLVFDLKHLIFNLKWKSNNPFNHKYSAKIFKLLIEKQQQLEALRQTSEKFNSTIDMDSILNYVFDVFKKFTGCDRCLVCLKEPDLDHLYCRYEIGDVIYDEVGKYFGNDSVVTNCFNNNSMVVKYNIFITKRGIYGDKLAIPLNISKEQLGVIFIETSVKNSFKRVNLTFLKSISNYAAVAMDKSRLFNDVYAQKQEIEALYEETAAVNEKLNDNIENLNKVKEELLKYSESLNTGYIQTVMSLVNAIEAKDEYTSGHCQRVMEIACEIASYMNLSEDLIKDLRYAAILHDIGKIGIQAQVLNKPERLSEEEFSEIKKHPLISFNILKGVDFLGNGLNAILEHHEKYNGSGYPNGLKGEEISLLGRILCIADAFDAMTSDRPYRRAMCMENAINEIERCKGIQFDPYISDIFIKMTKELVLKT